MQVEESPGSLHLWLDKDPGPVKINFIVLSSVITVGHMCFQLSVLLNTSI